MASSGDERSPPRKEETEKQEEPEYGKNQTVFVRGVREANEEPLREAFGQYGTVVKVIIPTGARGVRGYAFVIFETEDQANKAVDELNGKEVNGTVIECNISKYGKGETGRNRRRDDDRYDRYERRSRYDRYDRYDDDDRRDYGRRRDDRRYDDYEDRRRDRDRYDRRERSRYDHDRDDRRDYRRSRDDYDRRRRD